MRSYQLAPPFPIVLDVAPGELLSIDTTGGYFHLTDEDGEKLVDSNSFVALGVPGIDTERFLSPIRIMFSDAAIECFSISR